MALLFDQLLDQTISTFLIKGNPGCGKSTLALELLRRKGKGTYLSTRISPEKIAIQNPGIEIVTVGGSENDLIIGGVKIESEDLRLGSAANILKIVLAVLQEHPGGLIILDSWDSIAKELDRTERLKAEKTLVAMIQHTPTQVGFVSEEPNLTTTDYLVDAIVELGSDLHFDRIRRILEIKKMRGQRIAQSRYLFTLADGLFEICAPTERDLLNRYNSTVFEPSKSPAGSYSYGIVGDNPALRSGLRPGEVFAIEVADGVSPMEFHPTELVVRANFLANGVGLVVVCPPGIPPDYLVAPLRSFFPGPLVDSNVRIGSYEEYKDPCAFTLDPNSVDESFKTLWGVIEELKGEKKRTCALVINVEKLEQIHGREVNILKNITMCVARMRHNRDLVELQIRHDGLTESITSLSDQHWVIEEMHGALVTRFVKPSLPMVAIRYDFTKGYPQVIMKQIV